MEHTVKRGGPLLIKQYHVNIELQTEKGYKTEEQSQNNENMNRGPHTVGKGSVSVKATSERGVQSTRKS